MLLLLALIVALIVWAVSCATGGGDATETTGADVARDAADSADSTDAAPASASPSASLDPDQVSACQPGEFTVSVKTESGQYSFTQQPVFVYQVTSTASVACSLNVGTTQQQVVVGSGQAEVWKSTPCVENPTDQTVVLEPGQPRSGKVTWDLAMNDGTTCSKDRHVSTKGTYWVQASIGDRSSDQYRFVLQ